MNKILILSSVLVLVWIGCTNEPLAIEITHPLDGSVVGGMVRVLAEVTDSDKTDSIEIFVNDVLVSMLDTEPYIHSWNTFALDDSSSHTICAKAFGDDVSDVISDTVSVFIYNGPMIFSDNFESYRVGEYPSAGGWYELWAGAGSYKTTVTNGIAYGGEQCFELRGTSNYVRTDGKEVTLTDVNHLTYECAVIIPSTSSTGALFGFFVKLSPTLGTIFNGVLFDYIDNHIYVRGVTPDSTGYSWQPNTWYFVRVVLDYDNLTMNVWLGPEQIAHNIVAAPRETSDIFALATEYNAEGTVYYDEISIYGDSNY